MRNASGLLGTGHRYHWCPGGTQDPDLQVADPFQWDSTGHLGTTFTLFRCAFHFPAVGSWRRVLELPHAGAARKESGDADGLSSKPAPMVAELQEPLTSPVRPADGRRLLVVCRSGDHGVDSGSDRQANLSVAFGAEGLPVAGSRTFLFRSRRNDTTRHRSFCPPLKKIILAGKLG